MTATEQHAQALALIAERRGLIAAGTPGPWESSVWHYVTTLRTPTSTSRFEHAGRTIGEAQHANAALIVASRNDYEPLLDLPESVLLRHAPFVSDQYAYCQPCSGGERFPNPRAWPCPDAAAALRSLGLVT